MEESNSRNETGYEFIPLPKAPEQDPIPEILRDALEMKHFTLPKLPKKYHLPEVLHEINKPNTSPPILIPPASPSHLPTKSKKVPPRYKPNPRVAPHLPPEEYDLSQVDTTTHSRTTPTPRSCSSALPTHTKASKTNKNTCTCEKCHFDFEEREVFAYLPQNLASYLREEHQSLKRQNYPTQKVIEHGKQELELFKKYLPPHLLHKIKLEHQEREQKSFAEGHVQKASSCGCASSSSQKMENVSTSASPAAYSHSSSNSSSCCNCNPRDRSRSRNKCCCCCCCCHHPQQLIPYGGYTNTPPSPTPTTPPYTPPQGQGPGLPFGGPYGAETPTPTTGTNTAEGSSNLQNPTPSKTLREAFQKLLKEMDLWGLNISALGEIVNDPNTQFFPEIVYSYENIPVSGPFSFEGVIIDSTFEEPRIIFQMEPQYSIPLQEGEFYEEFPFGGGMTVQGWVESSYYSDLTNASKQAILLLCWALYKIKCTCDSNEPGWIPESLFYCCESKAIFANKNLPGNNITIGGQTFSDYYKSQLSRELDKLNEYSGGKICRGLLGLVPFSNLLENPQEIHYLDHSSGEVLVKSKFCNTGLWIEADKDILCKGSDAVVNLQAYTNMPDVNDGDILWRVTPEEAGYLASGTGFTNQFIPNPDYVSESYQDIKITAQLFDQNDSVKVTCASYKLVSRGVRKDEFADSNGINLPQDGPWEPDLKGRLFVDTDEDWDGQCIKEKSHEGVPQERIVFDHQRVIFATLIKPKDIPPEKLRVHWELEDPDDPASDKYIDKFPSYNSSQDPVLGDADTEKRGADNTGKVHEGEDFWFSGNYIEKTENYEEPLIVNNIIGKATTILKKAPGFPYPEDYLISVINFNFSDHGGDNFVIRAKLFNEEEEICKRETGTLTVWRKKCIQVMAMYGYYPSPSGNKENPYEIQKILQIGFGGGSLNPKESNPDTNTYIDFYVRNANTFTKKFKRSLELPIKSLIQGDKPIKSLIQDDQKMGKYYWVKEYLEENVEDLTKKKENFSTDIIIIGASYLIDDEESEDKESGDTLLGFSLEPPNPFIFINVGYYDEAPARYDKNRIGRVIIHEVGHKLAMPHYGIIKQILSPKEVNIKNNILQLSRRTINTLHKTINIPKDFPKNGVQMEKLPYEPKWKFTIQNKHYILEELNRTDKTVYYYIYETTEDFTLSTEDFHHENYEEDSGKRIKDYETYEDWTWKDCYFNNESNLISAGRDKPTKICARHVRLLRNSTSRYFWHKLPGYPEEIPQKPISYFFD